MNTIIRRIQRLEARFLSVPESEEDRRLRERIKAGRRRVEARRARGELAPPPSGPLVEARRLRLLQAMTGYRVGRETLQKMWKDKAP